MQKTTEEEENIFLSGFPIKNFGNDEKGGSPLNVSIETIKGAAPPHKPPERRKHKKTKEKDKK